MGPSQGLTCTSQHLINGIGRHDTSGLAKSKLFPKGRLAGNGDMDRLGAPLFETKRDFSQKSLANALALKIGMNRSKVDNRPRTIKNAPHQTNRDAFLFRN